MIFNSSVMSQLECREQYAISRITAKSGRSPDAKTQSSKKHSSCSRVSMSVFNFSLNRFQCLWKELLTHVHEYLGATGLA